MMWSSSYQRTSPAWRARPPRVHRTAAQRAAAAGAGHQAVVCLGALVEVAGWVDQGVAEARAGYPWLVSGPAFARRLAGFTGVPVRAR
jgi:hypothetical protein